MKINTARTLGEGNRKIWYGPVESKGDDLPPGKNIEDSVDEHGHMDLLHFLRATATCFRLCGSYISQCER